TELIRHGQAKCAKVGSRPDQLDRNSIGDLDALRGRLEFNPEELLKGGQVGWRSQLHAQLNDTQIGTTLIIIVTVVLNGGINSRMALVGLTAYQRDLRDVVREFAREQVVPRVREYDAAEQLPGDLLEEMRELGLVGGT